MSTLIAFVLILIFLLLSCIHVYWAFGGKWGENSVIPTTNKEEKAVMPGIIPTLIVALGLLCFAFIVLVHVSEISTNMPGWLTLIYRYGLWVIAGIFILRSIGDFRYIGFFKKIKNTPFGKSDTKYFSPLCLLIGVLTLILKLIVQ